jgi:hypothetical protein
MEEAWQVDLARLRIARRQHPDWSYPQLAHFLNRSSSWVKKWCRRLRQVAPDDERCSQELVALPAPSAAAHCYGSGGAHFGDP